MCNRSRWIGDRTFGIPIPSFRFSSIRASVSQLGTSRCAHGSGTRPPGATHGYRAASASFPTADRHHLQAPLVSRCLGEICSTWIECNLNGRNDWWNQAPGGSLQTTSLQRGDAGCGHSLDRDQARPSLWSRGLNSKVLGPRFLRTRYESGNRINRRLSTRLVGEISRDVASGCGLGAFTEYRQPRESPLFGNAGRRSSSPRFTCQDLAPYRH